MYRVSKNIPPPFSVCDYYERSCDPFAPGMIDEALGGPEVKHKPETGWMAIDFCENPVGFIPDGTEIDEKIPEYELATGFYPDGRKFAYPKEAYVEQLKIRHAEYAKQYQEGKR